MVKFVFTTHIDKNDLVLIKNFQNGTRVFGQDKKTGQKVELDQTLYEPKTFERFCEWRIDPYWSTKGYRAVENGSLLYSRA